MTAMHAMRRERDRATARRVPAPEFITNAAEGQFATPDAARLSTNWRWLHDYMNNSIVRDFFNRFSYCGRFATPMGKFPGDARSCFQTGVRSGRIYEQQQPQQPRASEAVPVPVRRGRRPGSRHRQARA